MTSVYITNYQKYYVVNTFLILFQNRDNWNKCQFNKIKNVFVPFNMKGCSEYPIEYNWYWTLDHSEYLCLNSLRLFFLSPIAFKQIKCVISSSEYTFVGVANRVILAVLQNLEKTQLHELLKYALGLNVKFNKPW